MAKAKQQSPVEGAQFVRYFGPLLDALRALGGSGSPMLIANAQHIADLAAKNRIPAIGDREYGAKPGDLPVEQATRFDVVINLKAARALGLTVPHSLLLRATQIVE
jgi:hypothetical protein